MRENNTGTFAMLYSQVDDTRSSGTYPLANWYKKLRGKTAKNNAENLTIEPVTEGHVLKLIRQLMGLEADKFSAAFSVRHAQTDAAFNTYMQKQTNRKTLALWHGNFSKDEYLAIYEVHVGSQLDAIHPTPNHLYFDTKAMERANTQPNSGSVRQGAGQFRNEVIVENPAQCTIRYIVRIVR